MRLYFSDLRCLKNVSSNNSDFMEANIKINSYKLFLKKWWVLTYMLTLFLSALDAVVLIINLNTHVLCPV